jgi:pimeloyl-ACP methyl ester carboxylesterase
MTPHTTNGGHMPVVDRGSHRLHWTEQGSGTPLLLIMGAAYSSRLWYPCLDALAAQHRVIAFDNRGIGQSSAVRGGSIADMADDALAVLDAAGVDSAHVYGVSLGGVVALQTALQSPERVRSLVLGCTGILDDAKPRAPRVLNLLAHLPAGLLASVGRKGYGSAAPADAIERDLAVLRGEKRTATGLKQQQNALRAYSTSKGAVGKITLPALVLHGTEDRAVRLAWGQELAETLPNARLVTYEGAGHNYLVSYPEQANADVLAFLASVPD